jgi:hypothetical protein
MAAAIRSTTLVNDGLMSAGFNSLNRLLAGPQGCALSESRREWKMKD